MIGSSALKDSIPDNDSPKFVCGIDALYFYVKVDYKNYSIFHSSYLLNGQLERVDNLDLNSNDYTKQFTWFTYSIDIDNEGCSPLLKPLCRIGFKNLNQKDNLDSIYIQMDSSMMNYLGYVESVNIVIKFLESISLDCISTKVSRVDLNTYCQGHDFEYLNGDLFSTKSRKSGTVKSVYNSGVLETFYMGSRSSDSVYMRIYNKRKELTALSLTDYSSFSFKDALISSKFNTKYGVNVKLNTHLWNVEFEVKRGTLKRYNINTLGNLFDNVDSLHFDIMKNTFRLLVRKKDAANNSRIDSSPIWRSISKEYKIYNRPTYIDKDKLKVYKKDTVWLKNRLSEFLEEPNNSNSPLLEEIQLLASKI